MFHYDTLLQNAVVVLSENASSWRNAEGLFLQMRLLYYEMQLLLQNATILLQNGTFIAKFIYYKMRWYTISCCIIKTLVSHFSVLQHIPLLLSPSTAF